MEATRDGVPVQLGGVNQRAALGYLLLHPNKIVATRELVHTLWGDGAPPTARKMVQNAIAGLRRALSEDESVSLSTSPPGYMLRLDPSEIDLTRFEELVQRGRAALAVEAWAAAARLLREALSLWRGPVLADVFETGVAWPESAVIREARLTAFEDCAEAELALGRHRELVGELAALADEEPVRERLCGLLMLSLYRCGRQPEALAVYQRIRDELVNGFGLDPAPELQLLERSILNQRPALAWQAAPERPAADPPLGPPAPGPRPRAVHVAGPLPVREPSAERPTTPPGTLAVQASPGPCAPDPASPSAPAAAEIPQPRPGHTMTERKQASVLMIRARVVTTADDPEHIDEALRVLTGIVVEEAERFGGLVHGTLGSVRPVIFGVPRAYEDDPRRAVRLALAVRERIDAVMTGGISVQLAVATGEVLATYHDAADRQPVEVTGAVLDECEALLAVAGRTGVRISDATCQASGYLFDRAAPGDAGAGREVSVVLPSPAQPPTTTRLIGRERELDVLTGLLSDVLRRDRPHLATVLGESGIGKTRLVAEFSRSLRGRSHAVRELAVRIPGFGGGPAFSPLAAVVRSYAGIADGEPEALARRKLTAAVHRLVGAGDDASWMLGRLQSEVVVPARVTAALPDEDGGEDLWSAGRRFIEEVAAEQPTVLLLEDVHLADKALLDQVEDLTERLNRVPLLIVVTARPELRQRRPRWTCGKRDATTLVLDPLPDDTAAELLTGLMNRRVDVATDSELVSLVGGIPLFAEEFARAQRDRPRTTMPPVPRRVRNVVAAQLDTLPPAGKTLLRDAAVLDGQIRAGGVAALSELDPEEAAAGLRQLEQKDFLLRVRHTSLSRDITYVFRHRLVREVAYAQLARRDRVVRHRRAVNWIAGLPADQGDLLIHHYHQIVSLTATTGRPTAALVQQIAQSLTEAGTRAAAAGARRTALLCYRSAAELSPNAGTARRQILLLHPQNLECAGTEGVHQMCR
ncbi:BTAD domain-containing putative transcriptional regulator [Streptomyces sp. NPDC059499]|uniref:BTAD domain-containing putative transcriptional regulator n=1 Tax=Streptomyces sp. NPDC059499 TaxID=3346852 RepID=UPI003699067F